MIQRLTQRLVLLLAVPCDWAGFQRAAYNPQREWLRAFAAAPEHHWQNGYAEDVAQPLMRLAREAQGLGVDVVFEATLADLAQATARADGVIVFAHWKGHRVASADLLDGDAPTLAAALAAAPATAALAARVRRASSRAALLELLQTHVDAGPDESSVPGAFGVRAHAGTWAARRRQQLDQALVGRLQPGNRLELSDGLFDVAAVEAAVAPDFTGVLDLTSCQARHLADHIDRQRLGACGVVQFEGGVIPEAAALGVYATLWRCEQGVDDYLQARHWGLQVLSEALQAEVTQTAWQRGWAAAHGWVLTRRLR